MHKFSGGGLQIRREIFEIYWKFAYERHRIFEARAVGISGPWTEDTVLRNYKFCNTYRAADRVSQHLIRNVCYAEDESSPEDRLFQIVAYRTFSSIETWEFVCGYLGGNPTIDDLGSGRFENALGAAREQNGRLYTGAFILCANNVYGRKQKHLNHIELFKHMFLRSELARTVLRASSLRSVYETLHTYPLMGDFMSYQTAIDINYSELTDFSENDFTQPGPGALRGIRKVFSNTGDWSPRDVVDWMVDQQATAFDELSLDFGGLWGRPLQAIDAQNLFCETDKYCREAVPSLKSTRTRIKSRYKQSSEPITLFFPPKWGINHRLPGSSLAVQPAPIP